MRVHLNYGRGQRAVDLPDDLDVTVIAKQAMPLLADPAPETVVLPSWTPGSATLRQPPSLAEKPAMH